jgi:hypothetical protein
MTAFSMTGQLNPAIGLLDPLYVAIPSNLAYAEGFYVSKVMPFELVRPAPANAVIGFYSPDYYGYVGRQTEIRITAQGGRYPYNAVIDQAPAGATISNDPTDKQNYLVLRFTPTQNGTEPINIRLYDATGAEMKRIQYTFTTSTDWCVFADPVAGVDAPASGAFSTPFKSIHYARNNTTGGKALILKNGTYTDTQLGITLDTASINSVLAWSRRQAIIDLASNVQVSPDILFYINNSNMLAQGLVIRNPQNAGQNPRLFSGTRATHYVYQDDISFEINGRSGTLNNDNISCFFMGSLERHHLAQTRCEFSGFVGAGNGWSAFDWYSVTYGKFECNTMRNQISSTESAGIAWVKGVGNKNIDIHNNTFETAMGGSLIDVFMANDGTDNKTGNVDVAFNLIRCTGLAGIVIARSSQAGIRLPVWTRRNTLVGGAIYVMTFGSGAQYPATVSSESDVIQSTISSTDPHKVIVVNNNDSLGVYRPLSYRQNLTSSVTNYECHSNSGVVDSAGFLTGSYAQYRGRRGHEIRRS